MKINKSDDILRMFCSLKQKVVHTSLFFLSLTISFLQHLESYDVPRSEDVSRPNVDEFRLIIDL